MSDVVVETLITTTTSVSTEGVKVTRITTPDVRVKQVNVPGTRGEKGDKGDAFVYDDFTPEQLEALKGDKGDAFVYDDFTPEQLKALTGPQGEKGDAFVYDDFTPEQLKALTGPQGETGSGLEISDTFDSESQLPSVGASGDAYFVGSELYIWSPSHNAWINKGPIVGNVMTPDPHEYFLYILNGGEPDGDGDPSATAQLNYAKLNAMVLA